MKVSLTFLNSLKHQDLNGKRPDEFDTPPCCVFIADPSTYVIHVLGEQQETRKSSGFCVKSAGYD